MGEKNNYLKHKIANDFVRGILLTLVLAILAGSIAKLPFFSVMGVMIISIFLGILWKSIMTVSLESTSGITFSTKKLLRLGIILMGLRLDLDQIIEAGTSILYIDVIVVVFTILIMILLGKALKVDQTFTTLIAAGTAICGAAAIVAIAPLIKAKKEYVAIAVASISVLGTIGTIFYSVMYAIIDLDSYSYGVLVGATLHELAHVVAAAVPGGDVSSEMAILVKMGRVALLIPVAIVIGSIFAYKNRSVNKKLSIKTLPVPWFIFGFLGMSLLNSTGILPDNLVEFLISISVLLLSMAMAGLGLSINFGEFKKVGVKGILVGVIGSILLLLLGVLLVFVY
ncbi:YeiH family protein [Aquibacillus koreensis]|uniref:YeiH family protein n=1 Tax=Aquibacillus koreensis TaxID=279446 RepID=A0A9X4AKA5_9BACI|nr:YeiH family protein [Aquibacillus koreensis]MCT2537881.1 YeiH family protein [Aquibacillus koreensis]MDC3422649.1 YeiH family protein [Aquibacillus koreensis]